MAADGPELGARASAWRHRRLRGRRPVFSLLQASGARLNERVASTLEIESRLNDPTAVFLTLALTGPAKTPGPLSLTAGWDSLLSMLQQFGWGLVIGGGLGWALAEGLRLLARLTRPASGARALLLSAGLAVFAFTTWMGGSGFLAVCIFGLVVGNRARGSGAPPRRCKRWTDTPGWPRQACSCCWGCW